MQLMTFIRGISIGFILGLLFAPDKGSATRRKLSEAAADITDDMSATFADVGNTISGKVRQVKNKAANMKAKAQQTYDQYDSPNEEAI